MKNQVKVAAFVFGIKCDAVHGLLEDSQAALD